MLAMLDAFTAATHPADAVESGMSQEAQAGVAGAAALHEQVQRLQGDLKFAHTTIAALNFELAKLKRHRFGASSESLDASTQAVLFDQIVIDTAQEDRAAAEAATPAAAPPKAKRQAVRQPLNPELPRVEVHHDLPSTVCLCGQPMKRVGEDTSEQMGYKPAEFYVVRHIRGKYACVCCQTIAAAPMPAQIIDKGIPAPSLLAQIIIAKHDDHLPLYRQEEIYAR